MLLARVAERLYWAARYTERAEDTARILRAHGDMIADLPAHIETSWEPLVAITGSGRGHDAVRRQIAAESGRDGDRHADGHASGELAVVRFLMTDREHPSSIASCVSAARENLRTARDTIPAEAWNVLNDLYLYVSGEADRSLERRVRVRFLGRMIGESRRLDGVLATAMTHDEAYVMWRLGRAIERADMTTRVVGVRAAAVLSLPDDFGGELLLQQQQLQQQLQLGAPAGEPAPVVDQHDEVQWMGVLRSVAGLQMYQRAARGPIEGPMVVRFLLEHTRFPRAVRALLREVRMALRELPDPASVLDAADHVDAVVRDSTAAAADGERLDDAMDALQAAIAKLDRRITERYLRVGR